MNDWIKASDEYPEIDEDIVFFGKVWGLNTIGTTYLNEDKEFDAELEILGLDISHWKYVGELPEE